ncbi:head GIN domain-containing protein [Maribacter luteus]|uniref:head GIN domain-containing protein n=1 Tax=Maribacter luteus TaxID=2594478 RepID=UPI002492DA7C|nr:head GIN domain-containing protein [Maribacter luteus]
MTTLVRITIALILALFLSSCGFDINFGDFGSGKKGNGNVTSETREITSEFTEVSASEGLDVYVTQGDEFGITVEADENIIDLIATDIKNDRLRIHAEENIGRATKKVFVTLPEIAALKSSSGAHLSTENMVNSDKLEIDGSSGANIQIEMNVSEVDIDASSGANLNLSGDSQTMYVDASSGANINAKKLTSKVCHADASSGGNVSVYVSDDLTADASSGGNISYSGDANVTKKKSVSGSVHKN